MRNIIKKGLILLLISLVLPIRGLSQTTLDSIQTKTLCLILNEHQKLSEENPLLWQKINSLEELNFLYLKSDSLQKQALGEYENEIISNEAQIKKLKSTQKKTIWGASIGGIVLFIIGLLL